jgi:hypothetical protein
VRIGKAPAARATNPDRKSALELALRSYADRKEGVVVDPAVGTSFDSLEEAYEFYNLYSWEMGFGVRFSKSRLNVQRTKCMQEIVCGCAVSSYTSFFRTRNVLNLFASERLILCFPLIGYTSAGEHKFDQMWLLSYDTVAADR